MVLYIVYMYVNVTVHHSVHVGRYSLTHSLAFKLGWQKYFVIWA